MLPRSWKSELTGAVHVCARVCEARAASADGAAGSRGFFRTGAVDELLQAPKNSQPLSLMSGRSRRKIASLSCNSRQLLILAKTQDMIGWRNFTEGKLTRYFRVVQKRYLSHAGASLTVDSWLKAFISKLMEMTQGMWIFRCISKHHHTKGSLVLASKAKLFKEIE